MVTDRFKTRTITYCALLAAIMCVCGPVCIPIGVIPVTFALCAVMLAAVIADTKTALISTVLYIALGALGMPVFSGGHGSLAVLLGPTGGYIWGYIPAVFICALVNRNKNSFVMVWLFCMLGAAVCYICGTIQYTVLCRCGILNAAKICIIPFVLPDAAKMALVSFAGIKIKNRLRYFV